MPVFEVASAGPCTAWGPAVSASSRIGHDGAVSVATHDHVVPPDTSSPPALRAGRGRWRDPRLAVGAAIVAVSALLGASLLGGGQDTVTVWAAKASLSAGQQLAPGDLVPVPVRLDASAVRHYLDAESAVPSGLVVTRDVGAGELVPAGALGPEAPALTEVPLAVAAEALPSSVRPGAVVDVWVAPGADTALGPESEDAVLALASVRVLDVDRADGALGPAAQRQVVVGLERERAAVLPEALGLLVRGTVVLVRTP